VFRRWSLTGAIIFGLATVFPGVAGAVMPAGPRLTYVREGLALPVSAEEELLSSDQTGERWERFALVPPASGGFSELTWSPDGSELVFSGAFAGGVYVLPASSHSARLVRGTKLGLAPAVSPDGKTIAFGRLRIHKGAGGKPALENSIWLVDSAGGNARRLTPWRADFILLPSAFAPDGQSLLAETEVPGSEPEIVSLSLAGGPLSLVIRNGLMPAYSPDGSQIAFVRYTHRRVAPGRDGIATGGDLFVAASDGSGVRQLTFSPARREASPGWDP